MTHLLTVVCSDALLYHTALQIADDWNRNVHSSPAIKLSYMTPMEWAREQKKDAVQGTVVLLDGLPWKQRFFSPIREYEDLGHGVKIGKGNGYEVICANPDKLLKLRQYEMFCRQLDRYTSETVKKTSPSLHSLGIYLLALTMLLSLEHTPVLALLEGLLIWGLLLERKNVKQQQYLYGTVLYLRSCLFLLPDMPKPADIK